MKLTLDLDLDRFYDEDLTIEGMVAEAVLTTLKKELAERVSVPGVKELADKIGDQVDLQVEAKLRNLINEEVAFTDRWGKPVFIGSAEDYIKKSIDERIQGPVDQSGKPIKGCKSGHTTSFIDYEINRVCQVAMKEWSRMYDAQLKRMMKNSVTEMLKDYIGETLDDIIMKKLKEVGVGK
jgi:hypothetical protein